MFNKLFFIRFVRSSINLLCGSFRPPHSELVARYPILVSARLGRFPGVQLHGHAVGGPHCQVLQCLVCEVEKLFPTVRLWLLFLPSIEILLEVRDP